MTSSKTTKRALFSSALAMVMCVAMLIGTTFAWFTDTASTSVNKIQAGTLDVALEMWDATQNDWVSAEGKTLDFVKAQGHENEEILWEPGCTYELPALRVVNKGNLALKYQIRITGIIGDAELNDVIDWTYKLQFANGSWSAVGNDLDRLNGSETMMYPEEYDGPSTDIFGNGAISTFKICGHMKEEAGNKYQGKSIDGISITVVATQATVESDSVDNQYDKNATYDTDVVTAEEFAEIMKPNNGVVNLEKNYVISGDWTSLSLLDGNVYHPQYVGKITINGNGHFIAGLTTALLADNFCTDLTIKDLTIKNSTIAYTSLTGSGNGAFIGYMNGYPISFENCHLENVTVNGSGNNLRVGGFIGQFDAAKITISDCTITNSTINGDSSAGGFVGQLMTNNGVEKKIAGCKLVNCKINSADLGDWRIGAIVGTVNGDGILTISNCSEIRNTYSMPNSDTAVNPGHPLYGRISGSAQIN